MQLRDDRYKRAATNNEIPITITITDKATGLARMDMTVPPFPYQLPLYITWSKVNTGATGAAGANGADAIFEYRIYFWQSCFY